MLLYTKLQPLESKLLQYFVLKIVGHHDTMYLNGQRKYTALHATHLLHALLRRHAC